MVVLRLRELLLSMTAMAALIGCGDAPHDVPDAAFARSCPADEIELGAPCYMIGTIRCMIDSDDCELARACRCIDGFYACQPLDFEGDCSDIEAAQCAIEGVHGCYLYPTSGERWCQDGAWQTRYSCPAGCPGPDEAAPETGDPCTVATGELCVYQSSQCQCVGGEFDCSLS